MLEDVALGAYARRGERGLRPQRKVLGLAVLRALAVDGDGASVDDPAAARRKRVEERAGAADVHLVEAAPVVVLLLRREVNDDVRRVREERARYLRQRAGDRHDRVGGEP